MKLTKRKATLQMGGDDEEEWTNIDEVNYFCHKEFHVHLR